MRRTRLYQILICLLCLSPAWSQAQSLSQYEYWFDDNFSDRQTAGLSGYETDIDVGIDARNLGNGLHKLCLRVKQSDGMYSPVTTSYFFKAQVSSGGKLEYWFDGNRKKINTVDCHVSSDGKAYLYTSGLDLTAVTPGYHTMYYRFVNDDGTTSSAVSVSSVFVTPDLSDGGKLEYWFDGNRKNIYTVEGKVSSDGKGYIINSGLDLTAVSPGHHTMYYRFTNGDGSMSSAVSMSSVFVTPNLTDGGKLEYWFDDDRENVSTVDGKVSSDSQGLIFNSDLDLKDVSEGMHRMYYRLLDTKGKPNSAVSMTPVMVKSKYNVANPEALTVTEQAYWFDDEEPEVRIVSGPKNSRDLPLTLDARKLSDGKHTLHLQYGNSADVWNGPVDFPFTKEKVDPPMIVANSSEKDGEVTLTFTSIPYGQVYTIVRKYPSGTERKVEDIKTTEHPTVFKSIDKVGPGTYTYYIKGKYFDADGVIQEVLSKEMSVTVDNVSSDVKRGTISGKIKNDGRTAGPGDVFYVYINGEMASSQSEYAFNYDKSGGFRIDNVPYGTEIKIGIKQNHYKFDDQTIIVNEYTTSKTIYFDGGNWTDEEEEILPEDDNYDLELTRKIHITQNGLEIPVYNMSSKIWSGNLIVKVIRKALKDKIDKSSDGEDQSVLDYLYYNKEIFYTTIADMPVEIQGCRKGSQVVVLDIKDLPDADKNEDYYVYVFSKKKGDEMTKMLQESYDKINPQVLEFNPYDYASAIENGARSVMDECVEVMKVLKQLADWEDPFKLAWQKCPEQAWNQLIEYYDLKKNETDKKLVEDQFNVILKSMGLMMNCFYGQLNQNIIKGLKENSGYNPAKKITGLYESMKKVKEAEGSHKFFELAKMVLKYSVEGGADPVLNCYKTYFEVGEAMIKAIEEMTYGMHDHSVWYKLHEGQGVYKIKIRKDTPTKRKEYFAGSQFYEKTDGDRYVTHDGQIKSISIKLIDPQNKDGQPKEVEANNVELLDDGIVIRNVKFPTYEGLGYEDVEAFMIIVWKNDRVTHVPLLDKDFVKLENFNRDNSSKPLTMTVEFQSGCYLHEEGIPNYLTFIKPETWLDF